MADYRYRTRVQQYAGGLGGQYSFTVNPTINWTDINGTSNGSRSYTCRYANSINGRDYQWVTIDVRVDWSVSYDTNNRLRVWGTTTITGIHINGTTPWGNTWRVRFRAGRSGNQIGGDFVHTGYTQGNWGTWGSAEFDWTINPGADSGESTLWVANWAEGYGSEYDTSKYTDSGTIGLQFHNSRAWNYDTPSFNSKKCFGSGTGGGFDFNVNFGNTRPSTVSGANNNVNKVTVEVFSDSDLKNKVGSSTASGSSSGTLYVAGLQPNTRYYARYTATNGVKTATTTCEFVTLARNTISNAVSERYNRVDFRLAVQNGGAVYPPTTKIWYKKCSESTWHESNVTSTTKTVADLTLTGLQELTCYQIQARTTTTAGTYTGNTLQFTTPEKDRATASWKSHDPQIDETTYETTNKACFKYEGNITPIKVIAKWRVKDGFVKTWEESDEFTFNQKTGEYCFTMHELFPNQTVYEACFHVEAGDSVWDGGCGEFTTPLLPVPDNYNCDNFQYLVNLICQVFKALKKGNKTIYATPYTQELCDPYSENSTLLTMWSRIQRFDHAAACLMCDMVDMVMKSGKEDQYYVGEIGWVTFVKSIEEIVKGEDRLVQSGTVYQYIAEKLHEVWHFHSTETYLVGKQSELPTEANKNESAIVAETSKRYVYNGTKWVEDTEFETDNFAVYHITKETNTSFGIVHAGSAYYYFEGSWNNLDADTAALDDAVTYLENNIPVLKRDHTEDDIKIMTVFDGFDYSTIPSNEKVVCFVIEDPDVAPPVFYSVEFDTDGSGTISPQIVRQGGKATEPSLIPGKEGHTFVAWMFNDNVYDFDTVLTKSIVLTASYTRKSYIVSFDSSGGGLIQPQTVLYGDKAIQPAAPEKTGYNFVGWMLNGDLYDFDTLVKTDIKLSAGWEEKQYVVTFDPGNGELPMEVIVQYGYSVQEPQAPTRNGYTFVEWRDENGAKFDFSSVITSDTTLTAYWTAKLCRVVFLGNGGAPSRQEQNVTYGEKAITPAVPSLGNIAFLGWYIGDFLYDFDAPIRDDIQIKAKWAELPVRMVNAPEVVDNDRENGGRE